MKVYELPQNFEHWVQPHLSSTGFRLSDSKRLAEVILQLSDLYQEKSSVTPWKTRETQAAYFTYFFPLNYIRFLKVLDEIKKLRFLDSIDTLIDFGCGPGPGSKALLNSDIPLKKVLGVDSAQEVRTAYMDTARSHTELGFQFQIPPIEQKTAVLASYTLNELSGLPESFLKADALIILEPSTQQAAESFQQVRSQLIENSFYLWAPCPHQTTCPLTQSKRDWCHDRVHWKKPEWFEKIEKHLPMKNETLTFTYLLAKKSQPPEKEAWRIVGDALVEKGKTRWMLCRSKEREFLSFLHRYGEAPNIHRGDLVYLNNFEKKGNELRFQKEDLKPID